jgi:hypothetical protein
MPPWLTPAKDRLRWSSSGVPSAAWNAGLADRPSGCSISRPRNRKLTIDCWSRSGTVRNADMSPSAARSVGTSSSDMPIHDVAQNVVFVAAEFRELTPGRSRRSEPSRPWPNRTRRVGAAVPSASTAEAGTVHMNWAV